MHPTYINEQEDQDQVCVQYLQSTSCESTRNSIATTHTKPPLPHMPFIILMASCRLDRKREAMRRIRYTMRGLVHAPLYSRLITQFS
jgi:hypothetical protein